MPCFSLQILILHKIHVLACIAQHLFNKARGNLAICHKKAWQSILEIDVVCANRIQGLLYACIFSLSVRMKN